MAEKTEKKASRKRRTKKAALTPRRQKGWDLALEALGQGQSNLAAAKAAGVDERTIRRWLKEDRFLAELEPVLAASTEAATRVIRGKAQEVASYITDVGSGKVSGTPQGVAAARDVLNRLKVGAGERLEVEGDTISLLTDDELEERDQARRKAASV